MDTVKDQNLATKAYEASKNYIQSHKAEVSYLGTFGIGYVLGALGVYRVVHRRLDDVLKSLSRFLDER